LTPGSATHRLLPYTPAEILAAFEDADCLASWWGPDGFSNTFEVFEFRPQGRWKFVMQGPDGARYPNESVFLETSMAKVVIQHVCAPHFTLSISLDDLEGETDLHWHQAFEDPLLAANIWHIIQPANEQNLNRLDEALARRHGQRSTSASLRG
jgi:hypothetical protein